jgi:hypothetical protein
MKEWISVLMETPSVERGLLAEMWVRKPAHAMVVQYPQLHASPLLAAEEAWGAKLRYSPDQSAMNRSSSMCLRAYL